MFVNSTRPSMVSNKHHDSGTIRSRPFLLLLGLLTVPRIRLYLFIAKLTLKFSYSYMLMIY
ncbi:hypothetical protein MA16_Dca018797 [Dendrobium catenatum]|uniref:Uncharacterized protein n=1 Tax=Dendrobium catenatum TaxID=906689 RepID=A0A2I0X3Z5_9ASPA|nr:hypothetical protein MA16_Dca018797 [Dendrobium catenatum]